MALVEIECAHCGSPAMKEAGGVNRAKRKNAPLYCDKRCAGLARRCYKTKEQKKAEKAEYDREYRRKNRAMLKKKKAEYFRRTYDPVAAAEYRKKRMHKHVAYCRRPEYKAYKRDYDRKYRANRDYGPLAEHFLLTLAIRDECLKRASDYDIRLENQTLGKSQKRKRAHARTYRKKLEAGPVGDIKRGQRR